MARVKKSKGAKRKNPRSNENGRNLSESNEGASIFESANTESAKWQEPMISFDLKSASINKLSTQEVKAAPPKKRKRRDIKRELADTPNMVDFLKQKALANQPMRREIKKKNMFLEPMK